jgi:hypothetical protein
MQLLAYLGALACTMGVMAMGGGSSAVTAPQGLYIFVAEECPRDMMDDRRIEVVQFLRDGRIFLNERELDRPALRAAIAEVMERRSDRIIYIAGEDGAVYGDVLSQVSTLVADTPGLLVVLATASQTGPVDPLERRLLASQGRANIFGFCVPRAAWNMTALGPRTQ